MFLLSEYNYKQKEWIKALAIEADTAVNQTQNSIAGSTFHEKLPDNDTARSKHVANVHNKTNDNILTSYIYYEYFMSMVI
jgi:hypothetical protein